MLKIWIEAQAWAWGAGSQEICQYTSRSWSLGYYKKWSEAPQQNADVASKSVGRQCHQLREHS